MNTAFSARIEGRVQGVFFRASTQRCGRALGLTGWVRNRSDGSVEVFASGDRAALDQFRDWLARGPEQARVDRIEVTEQPYTPAVDFLVR